jgi:hypothetical protein
VDTAAGNKVLPAISDKLFSAFLLVIIYCKSRFFKNSKQNLLKTIFVTRFILLQ